MFHFTNKSAYLAISSQPVWRFKANKPPGRHPVGAYFTTLPPDTVDLADRLGISREKVAYVFAFEDGNDLIQLRGGRGQYVFYSATDYLVSKDRQQYRKETGL